MANERRPSTFPPIGASVQDRMGIITPAWQTWFSFISANLPLIYKYDIAVDVTSVSANTTSEQSVTVPGVATNDLVFAFKPSHTTGLMHNPACRVSAKDTVNITFMNTTAGAINPASETYTFLVLKV